MANLAKEEDYIANFLYENDIPAGLDLGPEIALDTEATGLNFPLRDRLCVVQLSAGNGDAHLVKFNGPYSAPNLKKLLTDKNSLKIMHYARFDVGIIYKHLGVMMEPIYCTKIASRLVRTYTDRHGLKELCAELAGKELSKQQQSSDWGASKLSEDQVKYAASDVLYLHKIKAKLEEMLVRERRKELAETCFRFIPARVELDLLGWHDLDIFAH